MTSTGQDVANSSQAASGVVKSPNETKSGISQGVEKGQLSEISQLLLLSTHNQQNGPSEGTCLLFISIPCFYAMLSSPLLFLIVCDVRRFLSWLLNHINFSKDCLVMLCFVSLLHFTKFSVERCFVLSQLYLYSIFFFFTALCKW